MAPTARSSEFDWLSIRGTSRRAKTTRVRRAQHVCHFTNAVQTVPCGASFVASARSPPCCISLLGAESPSSEIDA